MDDLIESMSGMNVYLPEDEFDMLMDAINTIEFNVHKTRTRYERYIHHIDFSFHPLLGCLIQDFLASPSFEKMKTIDTTILTLLESYKT